MSEIIKFDFEGKNVRTVDNDGVIQWVTKDVCDVLELARVDSAMRALEDDEKGTHIVSTPGGPQEMSTVSESGLYALIFKSRKPVARRFRKWVTGEVLPMIRERGYYVRKGDEARVLTDLQAKFDNVMAELLHERNERLELLRLVAARPWGLLGDGARELLSRIRALRDMLINERVEEGSIRSVQKILDNRIRIEVDYPVGAWRNCPAEKANAAHSYISREVNAIQRRMKRRRLQNIKAKQQVIELKRKQKPN